MIGFVLSGGANLGSVQVGMLKALLEADIVPDVLVGTSIGSVSAAYLAAEPSSGRVDRLCGLWRDVRARDVFPVNPLRIAHALTRRGALFPSTNWRRFLERGLSGLIEDAAVPLRIMATDFRDGTSVMFESGSMVDAVLASTALPGIFPPHRIGDGLYLDGALSDQMPLKAAVDAGADTIYVLGVSNPSPPPDQRQAGQILRHSLTILLFPRVRLDALDLDGGHERIQIVELPSVATQVSLWNMSRHGDLIDAAYRKTADFLSARAHRHPTASDALNVAELPEMRVETEIQEPAGIDPRSADPNDPGRRHTV